MSEAIMMKRVSVLTIPLKEPVMPYISKPELKRLRRIERAAKGMVRAIDRRLDQEEPPLCWVTPWKAATMLIKAIAKQSPNQKSRIAAMETIDE